MAFTIPKKVIKKTVAAASPPPPPPSRAGPTSGGKGLVIPGYVPKTPTVAYNPSESGHSAADFAAAEAAKSQAEHVAHVEHVEAVHRAAARQQRLVSKYVTHAYSTKLKKQGVSPQTISTRIEQAKSDLSAEREKLLSHPAVQEANAEGKVVGAKGLQKVKRSAAQLEAIKGPSGTSTSKLFGTQANSLIQTPSSLLKLEKLQGTPQGKVGRTQAIAKEKAHEKGEPSTLEALSYASLGIPGVGLGADAARLAELGAETVPKLLAEGGAKQVAKDAARSVGESASSKAKAIASIPGKVAEAARSAKGLPAALRLGAKEAPDALKAAAKAAPKAIGTKGLQGAERSYQAFGGAAVLGGTHKAGLNLPGGALIEGQGKALKHDPGKVFSSTANLFPGLLVSAAQLPVAAGASAITGSPKPLEGALKGQADFFKHFAETYGSSDAKKIEQATLQEGLLPEILAGPGIAKGIEKSKGALGGDFIRDTVEGRRAPGTDAEGNVLLHEHGGAVKKGSQRVPPKEGEKQKLTRQGEKNQHRREEAFHAANMNDSIQLEHAARREGIDKYARKAAGEKTPVREGLGPKGKDTLHQRPPDYLPFLNRAGVDLHKPEAALREIQHYAEKYKGLDRPAKYGVNPEALTARDAVKFFTEHPETLKDKNLAKALDEFRAMQNGEKGLRSLSTSDRNRYLGHAVMHDIPDATERTPIGARAHTSVEAAAGALEDQAKALRGRARNKKDGAAKKRLNSEAAEIETHAKSIRDRGEISRRGAWADLKNRDKQTEQLRREGARKEIEARALGKTAKGSRLRRESKDAYARAKTIKRGREELHAELKDFTRPGAKANPYAKRKPYDAALEKEMADEARASLKAKGLHPEPAYTPDTDAINRATPDQSATGGQKPLPGGLKINEGYNWRHGLTRQGYEHMMNEAILRQVARNHQFADWRRFRADRGIEFEGAHQHYGKDWARAFDHGVMNRKDVALVPTQGVSRLEKATQGGDPTEYEEALAALQASRKLSPDDVQKGTIYEAYPKAAFEEKVQQAQKTNVPTWLRKANRYTGMNMLSTPAFLGMQVVAETAQAIASVNPVRMIQGLRAYNKMPIEARLKLSGVAGETAKAIFSPEDLQTTLGSTNDKPFTDALSFFRRNVFGRTAKSFATFHAIGEIDRLKGSPLRRAVITGQVMRDLNGVWAKGRKLLHLQTEIQKEIGHLPKAEQLEWVTQHPRVMDEYGKQLHDNMGGWGNLIRTGHFPESARAAGLVFYPFLRMSLQWPIKYAINHPVAATALAYLTAQNNWALKEALHGEPSFLNYAQIPVYATGKNGQPTTINLSRAAVGGNAIVQAIQGSGSALGLLQPVLAAGLEGATGQGPLGAVEGGALAHIKAAGASILGLSPYVRAGDTLAGQKASGQSNYGILGKRANVALEPLAALESKLKGSKGEQLERALLAPLLPQDIQKQRDYAKLGKVLGTLAANSTEAQAKQQATSGSASEQRQVRATVQKMQKTKEKAEGELEKLYSKYGLSKVDARSTEVYEYTHPYPDTESSKSPFESSGFGASTGGKSPFESSGFGGGSAENPIPVPNQSDGVSFKIPGIGGVLGDVASPLSALIGGTPAQAAELPRSKQRLAKKIVGSPSKQEVFQAGKEGKLALTKDGKITTPAVRKASKELATANARVEKTNGLTGPLTPGQKEFAEQVAKETGLSARVIGAQALAEESGGAAVNREAEGNHDWLNIGYNDSGPSALTKGGEWSNPKSAAKATSEFLKGQKFGPSQSIRGIIATAGQPDATQIAAIGDSDWATSGAYRESIEGTHRLIGQHTDPKAVAALKVASRNAKRLGLNPTPFNGDVEPGQGKTVKVRADAKGMVHWAESAIGTQEGSPKQLHYNAASGIAPSEPWCAAFVAAGLRRRGIEPPPDPAGSGSYLNWSGGKNIGTDLAKAKPGDLVVFGASEHIGLYVGSGDIVAGNWSDEVAKYPASEDSRGIEGIVRPRYKGGKVVVHESTALAGSTPEATFGTVASPEEAIAPATAAASATTQAKKKATAKAQHGLTASQRLKLVTQISEGNLSGLGIPGFKPSSGPSVSSLAALGRSLSSEREALGKL